MSSSYPYTEKRQITALIESLTILVNRDPEQEVRGMALPVLDAVIATIRDLYPSNPTVQAVADVISPDQIALGEPIRAADALVVAKQLDAVIGRAPIVIA
jgi:hypothetical protein